MNGFVNITGCLFTLLFIAAFQEDREQGKTKRKGKKWEQKWSREGRTNVNGE